MPNKDTKIVGYKYEAAIHCVDCTKRDYITGKLDQDRSHPHAQSGYDEHHLPKDLVDREWNIVSPVLGSELSNVAIDEMCDDCLHVMYQSTPDKEDAA